MKRSSKTFVEKTGGFQNNLAIGNLKNIVPPWMESKEGSDFTDLDDDMPNEMMMSQKFKNRKSGNLTFLFFLESTYIAIDTKNLIYSFKIQ